MSAPATPFATYGTGAAGRSAQREGRHPELRARLDCSFAAIDDVFDDCLDEALRLLSPVGLEAYLAQARRLGKLGRGAEPVLAFLEIWPTVARLAGEGALEP